MAPGNGVKSTVLTVLESDPPCAVTLGERKRGPAASARTREPHAPARGRQRRCRPRGVEQLVAQRAADEPALRSASASPSSVTRSSVDKHPRRALGRVTDAVVSS